MGDCPSNLEIGRCLHRCIDLHAGREHLHFYIPQGSCDGKLNVSVADSFLAFSEQFVVAFGFQLIDSFMW